MPQRLKVSSRLRAMPMLRLVSHNPHPVMQPDPTIRKPARLLSAILNLLMKVFAGAKPLLKRQHADGFWVAELEADTTLTSEYLMLRRFLDLTEPEKERKAVRYLTATQLPDGGWPIYYGGPSEISASVKAYFALKLSGVPQDEPFMVRAKEAILAKGGVAAANVFTKITLTLFDQYDWRGIPSMPPEIILLPKWFYFSIYAISYWSRTVLIPLLIVFAHRPICPISREQGIDELYLQPRHLMDYGEVPPLRKDKSPFTWRNVFITLDRLLKIYDRRPIRSLRDAAVQRTAEWMLARLNGWEGWERSTPRWLIPFWPCGHWVWSRSSAYHQSVARDRSAGSV